MVVRPMIGKKARHSSKGDSVNMSRVEGERMVRPSARTAQSVVATASVLCLGSFVVGLVMVSVAASPGVLAATAVGMMGCVALTGIATGYWALAIYCESRHAYTTMSGRFRHLKQLDARTGELVRTAGGAFELKRRRQK